MIFWKFLYKNLLVQFSNSFFEHFLEIIIGRISKQMLKIIRNFSKHMSLPDFGCLLINFTKMVKLLKQSISRRTKISKIIVQHFDFGEKLRKVIKRHSRKNSNNYTITLFSKISSIILKNSKNVIYPNFFLWISTWFSLFSNLRLYILSLKNFPTLKRHNQRN